MGIYLNPGNGAFLDTINSPIYVDKTGLLEMTNAALDTENKYICKPPPPFWKIHDSQNACGLL